MKAVVSTCLLLLACSGDDAGSAAVDAMALEDGASELDAAPSADASVSADLFDLDMIRDPSTANCSFTNERQLQVNGLALTVWDVSYTSWESIDGELAPILIRAYAARPANQTASVPGVMHAHGLGGSADENAATSSAAFLNMFVLSYSGPGSGSTPENTSEGRNSDYENGYRLFDTLDDPRGSWFWGHTVAALRGLTCLETRSEIDPARLGMTGGSAGAVATLLGTAVDDRIIASVPISGTLSWGVATEAANAWQHTLLANAGLSIDSPEWQILLDTMIRADVLLPSSTGNVFMANGSTDEFFPLTAHMSSYNAIGSEKRTAFAANFDHGCYPATGVEPAEDIELRAWTRIGGAQRAWFHHHFGTDPRYAVIPSAPTIELTPVGDATLITSTVDASAALLSVERVWVWWSNDDSVVFGSVELNAQGGGVWGELAAFPTQANTVAYVDVQYKTLDIVFPEQFSISSEARIPAGFVPRIRALGTCLP